MIEEHQWEAMSAEYLESDEHMIPDDAKKLFCNLSDGDINWLVRALAHTKKKWFAAQVFATAPSLPDCVFEPLIFAAIYEKNPSFNRYFVEPCVKAFGIRRVIKFLLHCVDTGSDLEKAGAVNALYWAVCTDECEEDDILENLYAAKRKIFLKQFIENPNPSVRRSIIASLSLDPQKYPADMRPLITEAISIARNSADEYIRHRVEVQLGTEKLFQPLPPREVIKEVKRWWKFW